MLNRTQRFDTIIVALDGTRAAEAALLGVARDLARLYDAGLVLVRAADSHALPAEPDPAGPGVAPAAATPLGNMSGVTLPAAATVAANNPSPMLNVEDTNVAGYLNILDNQLRDEGFRVEFVDTVERPAEAILDAARAKGAGLIVMGTRQRSAWERLFKGSTAEQVLRDSPCPVLAVPLD